MPDTPTIRQLATLAKVSRTTVSLALNNHPRILASTRKRIQRLALEHGYNRDPVVASLMARLRVSRKKRATEKIAFLTYWPTRDGWRKYSASSRSYFAGACARAEELGYEIEEIWAKEPGLSSTRLSTILYTRGIRGLLISSLLDTNDQPALDWPRFAAATSGFSVATPLHRVAHSHFNGMQLALRELTQLGYSRIGFVTRSDQDDRVNHGWLGAYLVYERNISKGRIAPLISREIRPREFQNWVKGHKPDVVVSNLPEVWELFAQSGIHAPRDIGYASLDLLPEGANYAGVDQQHRQMGAVAADLVIKLTQNNEYGLPTKPVTMHIDGVWKDSGSVSRRTPEKAPLSK